VSALNALLVCAILVVGLSSATVLVLRGPLLRLLVELCRSENHGRFWFAFACLAIVLSSLFGASSAIPTDRLAAWSEESFLELVVTSFRSGLVGLLLALAGLALALLVSIAQRGGEPEARPVRTP
jgi:hypothetical protein